MQCRSMDLYKRTPGGTTRGTASRLIGESHPLPLDLDGQSGETVIEDVSALSRVALGCVGRMPWG
jgi:hypothetical protein